jgi:diguanylate cyclase
MSVDPANENWRIRYEELAQRNEKSDREHARIDELMRRALSRLSIAANGIDSRLDRELDQLREVVRDEVSAERLNEVVEQLSATLAAVEEEQQRDLQPRQALAELISRLPFKQKMKQRADELRSELLNGDQPLQELEEHCANLIGEALGQGDKGLFGRLLDRQKESGPEESGVDNESINHVLLRLLEKLSVPPEFGEQARKLRKRLLASIEQSQWQSMVDELAALIAAMAHRAEQEKQELEGFFHQIADRLKELDEHLSGSDQLRQESRKSGEEFNSAIQDQVRDLHTTTESARDLNQLKQAVRQRMEAISQRMDTFRRMENQRHAESDKRYQAMQDRLQNLEQESGELRKRLHEAHRKASSDALTGIANRLGFDERLALELARFKRYGKPLSLLVIDVDHFKRVNDQYGHKAGDLVLKTIAQTLRQNVRTTDFLARFGGEEFVTLLPDTDGSAAWQVAEKLRESVFECGFHHQGQRVTITISIGIASFSSNSTFEQVFERADTALYSAKTGGRNRCVTADPAA